MTLLGLFLNRSIRTGGHRRYLNLLSGLAARGHRVVILIEEKFRDAPSNVEIIPIKVAMTGRFKAVSRAFAASARAGVPLLREQVQKVDAVLIFGETNTPSGMILAKAFCCPLIFGLRSNSVCVAATIDPGASPAIRFKSFMGTILAYIRELRTVNAANRMVFQSAFDRNDFISRFPSIKKKSGIVRNAFIEPWFSAILASTNVEHNPRKLLFVGNGGERKGLYYLISAINIIRSEGIHDVSLDVVGMDTHTGESFLNDSELGLVNDFRNIHFLGERNDVLEFMATSGLLVVPSVFDSYPNVILEALHVGLPVLATRTGGIPDMLGENALMVPPRDSKALAEALRLLLNDAGRYEKLRKDCSERRSHFSFDWFEAWEQEITAAIMLDGKDVRC